MAVLPTPGSPMSAGLFLVRRARICTTRSISFLRPITGSSSPRRASSVRSTPSCSRTVLSFSLRAGCCELPCWDRFLAHQVIDPAAHNLSVHVQALQDRDGHRILGTQKGQQQVLRTDIVMTKPARFVDGQLDHPFGLFRELQAGHQPLSPAHHTLHSTPHLVGRKPQIGQYPCGNALFLAHQTKQQVFSPNVSMVHTSGFFLGHAQAPGVPAW